MNRKKYLINILFCLLIVVLIYIIIIKNDGMNFILKKRLNTSKFVTFNIKNAKESRFSLSDKSKEKSTIYYLKKDNKYILIELIPSTVLTDKVNLMYMDETPIIKELKDDIKKEQKLKSNFKKGYYTNYNLKSNLDIINIKIYLALFIVFISIISMTVNLFKIIKKI